MSKTFVLRARSKNGRFVINKLTPDSTLWKLQKALEEKTSIEPHLQKILNGYPPEQIPSYEPTASLAAIGIKSGDSLIVEHLPVARCINDSTQPATTSTATEMSGGDRATTKTTRENGRTAIPSVSTNGEVLWNGNELKKTSFSSGRWRSGKIVRKVVPADNCCLFRSISLLLSGGRDSPSELRQLAAGIILSCPGQYSSAVLGRSSQEYTQWLLKEQSWGGAIELAVYSDHFKTELDVVDIQSQRIDRFGENRGYSSRALLIYDGIHYDPLVMEGGGEGRGGERRTFPVSEDTVLVQALELASKAKEARQFTDVSGFSLRCLVCGRALTGQADAQRHAQTTGHINFGEV